MVKKLCRETPWDENKPYYTVDMEQTILNRLRNIDSNRDRNRIIAFLITRMFEKGVLSNDDIIEEILHNDDDYSLGYYKIRDVEED